MMLSASTWAPVTQMKTDLWPRSRPLPSPPTQLLPALYSVKSLSSQRWGGHHSTVCLHCSSRTRTGTRHEVDQKGGSKPSIFQKLACNKNLFPNLVE